MYHQLSSPERTVRALVGRPQSIDLAAVSDSKDQDNEDDVHDLVRDSGVAGSDAPLTFEAAMLGPLRDVAYLGRLSSMTSWEPSWPNGADLAPGVLHVCQLSPDASPSTPRRATAAIGQAPTGAFVSCQAVRVGVDETCPLPDDPILTEAAMMLRDIDEWGWVVDAQWRVAYHADQTQRCTARYDASCVGRGGWSPSR